MPELPDLLYIKKYLDRNVCGRTIVGTEIRQPVVLRMAVEGRFEDAVAGQTITRTDIHGPFIQILLSGDRELIINLMLAGRLQHQRDGEKTQGHLCISLLVDDGSRWNVCDEQKMAKIYLVPRGKHDVIPKFREQGVNILDATFTLEMFKNLAAQHSRKQVRVFINDHTILSAIGNAYADEILFDARIHPKTYIYKLRDEELAALHTSIRQVMEWGIAQVEAAAQPIQVKVREHMKVRNRKGKPCSRCGTTIRREGVRGYDVFFCPECQSATRRLFIDWKNA